MDGPRPSERAVAERHKTSRHAVRQALAEGIANLSVAFDLAGLPKEDTLVAQLAWRDGRVSPDIANRMNLASHEVQVRRRQLARKLHSALRSHHESAQQGEPAMAFAEFLKKVLLDNDRARSTDTLKAHAHRFREGFLSSEADDVQFTPEELAVLKDHPERLGELYDAVFPEEEFDEMLGSAAAAISQFEREQTLELVRAFEAMAFCLPRDLQDWGAWFPRLALSEAQLAYLQRKPAMAEAGEFTRGLLSHGLIPETFAESFAGFALLFDLRASDQEYQPLRGEETVLILQAEDRQIPITVEDLIAQTQETPGLPEVENVAAGLTRWTLSALSVLPLLIPGYRLSVSEDALPLVAQVPSDGMDLTARWTHRASELAERSRRGLLRREMGV